MKRFHVTIIAFLVLAVFGGAVYWFEIRGAEEREKRKEKENRILSVSFLSLETLTIEREGKGRVTLSRKGADTWEISEPIRTDADAGAVKSLANRLQGLDFRRVVEEEPADLGKYGLAEPPIRVYIRGNEREETLELGNRGPIGNTLYVKTAARPRVYLVDSALLSAVDKGLFDLRERRIVTFERNQAEGIRLTYPDREIRLAKIDLQWRIREPGDYPADESVINQMLTELITLKAEKFVTEKMEDPSAYGLDRPRLEVELTLNDGTNAAFRVGRQKDSGYCAHRTGGDPVYLISPENLQKLTRQVDELRDKTLLGFDRDSVLAVEFARPATSTIRAERAPGEKDWKITYPFIKEIPQYRLSSILLDLKRLKVEEFVDDRPQDLTPFGFDNPFLGVTVFGAGDQPLASLTIGKSAPRHLRYAKTGEEPVYAVAAAPLEGILKKIADILGD